MCVQRFDDSQFCISHYVSHFAAFFIVARAKISVAESCHSVTFFDQGRERERDMCLFALVPSVASSVKRMNQSMVWFFVSGFESRTASTRSGSLEPCDHGSMQVHRVFWLLLLLLRTNVVMILPQVHLRKPCYDFTFL
jgi:hypothetical protein